MTKPKPPSDPKNRRDHYSPQGYLRGFVHPDREQLPQPLWVLQIGTRTWSEKSTSQIAWERGFYDYSADSAPDATADAAFRRLEHDFPRVRDHIRRHGYESWIQHRGVLVSFAAMMAARSPLFRAQTVSQVLSSLAGAQKKDVLAKNYSITLMRSEIERRADDWQLYEWVLGYTTNPEHPFVTSDQGVGMRGNARTQAEAFERRDFWLWCPLSWDMCLIGSSKPLSSGASTRLRREHITEIQELTRDQARVFVASPVRLEHLAM